MNETDIHWLNKFEELIKESLPALYKPSHLYYKENIEEIEISNLGDDMKIIFLENYFMSELKYFVENNGKFCKKYFIEYIKQPTAIVYGNKDIFQYKRSEVVQAFLNNMQLLEWLFYETLSIEDIEYLFDIMFTAHGSTASPDNFSFLAFLLSYNVDVEDYLRLRKNGYYTYQIIKESSLIKYKCKLMYNEVIEIMYRLDVLHDNGGKIKRKPFRYLCNAIEKAHQKNMFLYEMLDLRKKTLWEYISETPELRKGKIVNKVVGGEK